MSSSRRFLGALIAVIPSVLLSAQAGPRTPPATQIQEACPREPVGSAVSEPYDRPSKNGVLRVALTVRTSKDAYGHLRYCYADEHGNQAPTLRVQPGDALILSLTNKISPPPANSGSAKSSPQVLSKSRTKASHDPCSGGSMSPYSTNLHFHGLAVSPVCHQDETLRTLVEPGDPPFEYRIEIPKNQPPGLYWYHPHVHGFTEEQLLGGASGALIIEGIEHAVPRVAGLPQRVLVIRDEKMPELPSSANFDPTRPTKQLTINNIPVPYPKYPPAVINMKPNERQFWRVLNASADTFLSLAVEFDGKRQNLNLVALDGVPLHYGEPGAKDYSPQQTDIFLPPAGRAEFVITGPPVGVSGLLLTRGVYRGAGDDNGPIPQKKIGNQPALRVGLDDIDPKRPLATIIASSSASTAGLVRPPSPSSLASIGRPLSSVRPMRKRSLYFSERLVDPGDPKSATLFFITEEGHSPVLFDPHSAQPKFTVRQGDVEDWTIENRSQEAHSFHAHQLHFIVIGSRGVGWEEPTLRDTVNVPAWSGFGPYPSVTLRMDFRDPRIVGTFPFHCHIMQHVDGGMMGLIRVEPAPHEQSGGH
jgi:FtsP/CotA-like multicopper oxidase with cupredoxin domain